MKISKGTIIRLIMLVIVIANLILKAFGKNIISIDEGTIAYWLETFLEIAVIVVAFWKNNSFSEAAIKADEFLHKLKNGDEGTGGMAKYRSPFKASSRETTAFKKKGNWAAGYHTGIDRVCDSNRTLVSPANGTVQRNEYNNSYGYFVVITTDEGMSILMAHMKEKSALKVGAKIKAGDIVGTMGSTGNSTGPHLHIEVENTKTWAYNTKLLNPNDYIDWNNTSSVGTVTAPSASGSYPTAVDWKNGSTKETVYKQSNLKEEIGSLSPKESAKCYGEQGNGYAVVYALDGTSKHKAGFVKYAGGVKTVPTGGKTYKNGSTAETVYADTAKNTKVGTLDKCEECKCLSKIDGMYLVLYKVKGTSNYKCGFVTYNGGC